MKNQIREYYKQIEKALNCPRALRKKFICDVRCVVQDYLGECPEATFDEVKMFVGEPDELAATFIESLQPEVVVKHIKKKRHMRTAVIVGMTVLLIGMVIFSIYSASIRKNAVITKESTIIIYETEEERK